jgi:hypothetical protein
MGGICLFSTLEIYEKMGILQRQNNRKKLEIKNKIANIITHILAGM